MGELKQQTQLEEHGGTQRQAKISVSHIALSRTQPPDGLRLLSLNAPGNASYTDLLAAPCFLSSGFAFFRHISLYVYF